MDTFLRSIAKAYVNRYNDGLSDVCFVFPGKRAGSFFLNHVKELIGNNPMMLPAVTSIADFIESLSERVIDSRLDEICLLFDIYRKMQLSQKADVVPFDKFQSWADTMLSDFNDVEMYCVNPESLFRNVRILKNIKSNYLTDEQMNVMRQYFGFNDLFYNDTSHLWQHYTGERSIKKKFLTLFDSLGILYKEFCDILESRGLTFSGRAYTQALENIKRLGTEAFPYKRIVMVGFNALTTVEFLIFKELKKLKSFTTSGETQPLADFYWDCTGVPLSFEDNIGRHFVAQNRKHFPSIFDISDSDCAVLPAVMESISAPSGVAQAKIAGQIVNDILKKHKNQEDDDFEEADIAVILPDENMLLPMLYSLPVEIDDVNLTMGYPFSLTSVSAFFSLLETYQKNLKSLSGRWMARTNDITSLLSNPVTELFISPSLCLTMTSEIKEKRRNFTDVDNLMAQSEGCKILFNPLGRKATSVMAFDYLARVLTTINERIEESDYFKDSKTKNLDQTNTEVYIDALRCLQTAFETYSINANATTAFGMVNRLLASEAIRFEGEPLHGVQVMGPLETRCIDFAYIVIPSMNERIYPRRLHSRSFIPAVVRRGHGMATTRFQEAIFTYYFYRMISRAREVYLIYDSRTEGLHSGSPSRFILQLQHLYAKNHITNHRFRFILDAPQPNKVEVTKTPEIMRILEQYFTPGSGKALSASALNRYISCPLRFYLNDIRKINKDYSYMDGLQGADQGKIIHKALQDIYLGLSLNKPPFSITHDQLLKTASDSKLIKDKVIEAINSEYYNSSDTPLSTPDAEIDFFVPQLCESLKSVLMHDARLALHSPFLFLSAEKREFYTLKFNDGLKANFLYIIDRLDCLNPAESDTQWRIVDYKTGGYDIDASDMAQLFDYDHPDEAFQLLLYAILLKKKSGTTQNISTVIYDITKMGNPDRECMFYPKIGASKILEVGEVEEDFMSMLNDKLNQMLNPEIPFRQAPHESESCRYCPFAHSVCGIANKEA